MGCYIDCNTVQIYFQEYYTSTSFDFWYYNNIHSHDLSPLPSSSSFSSFSACPLVGGRVAAVVVVVVVDGIIFFAIDDKEDDDEEGSDTNARPIETTFPSVEDGEEDEEAPTPPLWENVFARLFPPPTLSRRPVRAGFDCPKMEPSDILLLLLSIEWRYRDDSDGEEEESGGGEYSDIRGRLRSGPHRTRININKDQLKHIIITKE